MLLPKRSDQHYLHVHTFTLHLAMAFLHFGTLIEHTAEILPFFVVLFQLTQTKWYFPFRVYVLSTVLRKTNTL